MLDRIDRDNSASFYHKIDIKYYILSLLLANSIYFILQRCTKDADTLLTIAKQINSQLASPIEDISSDVITRLSMTSQGCFAPLCAYLGGAVAQEALKAVTGKFSPLKQWVLIVVTVTKIHFDIFGNNNCYQYIP